MTALISNGQAEVNGLKISVGHIINFKPAGANDKVRAGVVEKFWVADKEGEKSVWTTVKDPSDNFEEAISLELWKEYIDKGLINY